MKMRAPLFQGKSIQWVQGDLWHLSRKDGCIVGRDKNEELARGRLRRPRKEGENAATVDWCESDAVLLQKTISTASARHCALRFGYSRDGGAYAVGVYAGEQYFTDYIRPSESIDDYLTELLKSLEEYDSEGQLPTGKTRAKR